MGKQLFSVMGPEGEDDLFQFLQQKLRAWETSLDLYKTLVETGRYPGREEIGDGLTLIKTLLACDASSKFIERFNERKDDLLTLGEYYHDLEYFYEHQRPTWDKLRRAYDRFQLNRLELERDVNAARALNRMGEIQAAPSPYGLIKDAEGLIATVEGINKELVTARRTESAAHIDRVIAQVQGELDKAKADEKLRAACLGPLQKLRLQVENQESLAHITQAEQEADRALENALSRIEDATRKAEPQPGGRDIVVAPPRPRRVIRPAELMRISFLETQDDVEGFLDALRNQLSDAIAKGERIQIR